MQLGDFLYVWIKGESPAVIEQQVVLDGEDSNFVPAPCTVSSLAQQSGQFRFLWRSAGIDSRRRQSKASLVKRRPARRDDFLQVVG